MVTDELIAWLDTAATPQRDKLAAIRAEHVPLILASSDDDHRRIVKTMKKRLGSPKLVDELAALLADVAREYAPPPPPIMQRMDPMPRVARLPAGVLPIAPRDANEQQLIDAIVETPDTGGPYLVYGDFLQTRGDVRGALPIIATRGETAHAAYVEEHRDAIMGKLGDCSDLLTEVEWKYGFIAKCHLAYTSERFNAPIFSKRAGTPTRERITIPDVLGWLLDEPGPGRFLLDLTVGLVMQDDQKYDDVAAVLARRPRPLLRRLALGDFNSEECELNWCNTGDLSAVWPQVPNLQELWLRSGAITTGPIDLPKLERLTTITGGMSAATLGHIASARWPALRELSLQIGCRREGAARDVALVEPLLAGTHVPALRRLGLVNCEMTDELCARLGDAPVTAQLEALDLSMGTMSDDGADALIAAADRLRHLHVIDVSDNYLTPAGAARLTASGLPCVIGEQRDDGDDPDDRRASAYE